MPQNKQAQERLRLIDSKLGTGSYGCRELADFCKKELGTYVSVRTIQNDLEEIRTRLDDEDILIWETKDRVRYYHYREPNYSLWNKTLTQRERELLASSINDLARYAGRPGFEWLDEMKDRLKLNALIDNPSSIISYSENPYYKGRELIPELISHIMNKNVLRFQYSRGYNKPIPIICSPCFLKQFSNRWFLYGMNNDGTLGKYALDRIDSISISLGSPHIKCDVDFEEYFEGMVGVSEGNSYRADVLLWFSDHRYPYVQTKPIVDCQSEIRGENESDIRKQYPHIPQGGMIFKLIDVLVNKELEAEILHYGEDVLVIEPEQLRGRIISIFQGRIEAYNSLESPNL